MRQVMNRGAGGGGGSVVYYGGKRTIHLMVLGSPFPGANTPRAIGLHATYRWNGGKENKRRYKDPPGEDEGEGSGNGEGRGHPPSHSHLSPTPCKHLGPTGGEVEPQPQKKLLAWGHGVLPALRAGHSCGSLRDSPPRVARTLPVQHGVQTRNGGNEG